MSEKYCNDHGYIWGGPDKVSDRIVVQQPNSGKAQLMKQEDADKLFINVPPIDEKKEEAIAKSLSDEGLNYYKAKQDDLAIVKYEEALKHEWTAEIFYRYGNSLSNVSRMDEAIKAYQWAYILKYEKSYLVLYNIACAYSRINKSKAAFTYLEQAIKNGYKNFDHIQKDDDLEILRSQPEWNNWWAKHRQS